MTGTKRAFLVALLVFTELRVVQAESQVAAENAPARSVTASDGSRVDVFIHPQRVTTLQFASSILDVKRPPWTALDYRLQGDEITIRPHHFPKRKVIGSFRVLTRHATITINLLPALKVAQADWTVQITPRIVWDAWGASAGEALQKHCGTQVANHVERALTARAAEFSKELAKEKERHTLAMREVNLANAIVTDQAMLDQVTDRLEEIPVEAIPCISDGVSVCEPKLMLMGDGAILRFTAQNNSPHEAPVANVRVIGLDGENLVTSTNMEEQDGATEGSSAIGVIPPGGSAVTSVKLRDPERLGFTFHVVLAGNSGALPVKQPVHLMDRMQQQAEERRRRYLEQKEAERVSLHFVGTFGAIWLPSGISGDDTLEPAALTGVGFRVTKGFLRSVAVEAEVAGATSGMADYGTVVVDGVEGQLTRSANLARAQFGGVLRFGDKIVPTLRAGLGLQVVSQDSVLMTGAGGMNGPGSGVEVGGSVYGGVGVDIKLGSNWVVGAGVSFIQSDQRILNVGINLAYRWDAD